MIYEYAVDPKTVSNWTIFKHIVEWFGVEHGRVISEYPKNWKKRVYEACDKCKDIEKKRIENLLVEMKRTIPARRDWNNDLAWIENAINQHNQKPFRAILSFGNADKHDDILDENRLDSGNPLWNVPTAFRIKKTKEDITKCFEFLVQISKKIKLIDPYLSTDKRYLDIVVSFLEIIAKMDDIYEMQIHTKTDTFFTDNKAVQKIKDLAKSLVGVYVYQWEPKEGGDNFHARYVLSKIGGICFDSGLNVGKEGETTDVTLLSRTLFEERWRQFDENSQDFNLVKMRKL